jgi:hypothetical protein
MGRRSGPDITAGRFSFRLIDIRGATEGIAHVDLVRAWHCGRGRSGRRRNPKTEGRYPLDDLDDDDTILDYEIRLIARRLDITLP